MQRLIFSTTCLLVISFSLSAQQICGNEETKLQRMKDPAYKARLENYTRKMSGEMLRRKNNRTLATPEVYTIPIVVHVMHKGEPEGLGVNVSDEKIFASIKELNDRFRKVAGSVGDGNSVDMEYQFALAVRDPNGNATNGINRIDMTSHQDYMDHGMHLDIPGSLPGMDEATLKFISMWDQTQYVNVWVVSSIVSYAGVSSMPHEHGVWYDGILIWSGGIGETNDYPALTHEFGHYVGLEHVFNWGDDVNCPPNDNCLAESDGVCDTPPQLLGAPCELTPNPCNNGELLAAINYMSYSCMREFTQGQKERSRVAFDYFRSSLLAQHGNMSLVPVAPPVADFQMTNSGGTCVVAGTEIRLSDRSQNVPNTMVNTWEASNTSFSWTITNNDGVTLTSTDQHPTFIVPTEGLYDVSLTVTTSEGTSAVTRQNLISVIAAEEVITTPSCRPFTMGGADYQTRTDDIGIREVIFSDLHHVSGTAIEDIANGTTNRNAYGDFSCSVAGSLEPFTEYTIKVLLSEFHDENVFVYIDFDDNGITAEDMVTAAYNVPAGSGLFELPVFTTPAFPTFNTLLRMRVIDTDASDANVDVCNYAGYYGEIHDYAVILKNISPIAEDDEVTTNEDTPILIPVTANDHDADGTLWLGSVDLDPSTIVPDAFVTVAEGTWQYASGNNVRFTPAQDFNGAVNISYAVSDNRYVASPPATITVNVTPVNDAPSFTKGADGSIDEDAGVQLVNGWATSLSSGPSNESSQLLTFNVTNDNPDLFSTQPSIDVNGNLSYTPASDAFGSAMVSAVLRDNGGTANGGIDTYATQTFTITVNAVNDAPLVVDYSVVMKQGNEALSGDFSSGDLDVDGVITYTTTSISGPDHGEIVIHPDGTFTYTPDVDFSGTDVIIVNACDDGTPSLCTQKTVTIDVQPVTSIEPGALTPFKVYPNPSSGEFKVSVPPALRGSTIKIFDTFGRKVYESTIDIEKNINLSHAPKAIYLLWIGGKVVRLTVK